MWGLEGICSGGAGALGVLPPRDEQVEALRQPERHLEGVGSHVPWLDDSMHLWKLATFVEIRRAVPLLMSCMKMPGPAPAAISHPPIHSKVVTRAQ